MIMSIFSVKYIFASGPDYEHESIPEKHIEILHQYSEDYPHSKIFNDGFKNRMEKNKNYTYKYSHAYLNLDHFPNNQAYMEATIEYLKVKKENVTWEIDLVISSGEAYEFVKDYRQEIFGGTPIISIPFSNSGSHTFPVETTDNVINIISEDDYDKNVQLMLDLQPELKRIYIVIGNSKSENIAMDNIKQLEDKYRNKVEFEYLHDVTHDEMLNAVYSANKDSAVLFVRWIEDKDGNLFIPDKVIKEVAKEAKIPIYGTQIQYLGGGIVGGCLYNISLLTEEAAEIAKQIIDGKEIEDIEIKELVYSEYVFDNRVMERFGIDTAKLPTNSRIEYKENNFFSEYGLYLIIIILIIIAESALIVGFITNYRRRMKAENRTVELQGANLNLKEVNRELDYSNRIDPLTGSYNRFHMDEQLIKAGRDYLHKGIEYTLMMLDIDEFKQFNDNYGHEAGDEILEKVAETLKSLVRDKDVVCRWGGEEFLILCINLNKENALIRGELIRTEIEKLEYYNSGDPLGITVTIGVATVINNETYREVLNRADEALYEGKRTGKNKIIFAY